VITNSAFKNTQAKRLCQSCKNGDKMISQYLCSDVTYFEHLLWQWHLLSVCWQWH